MKIPRDVAVRLDYLVIGGYLTLLHATLIVAVLKTDLVRRAAVKLGLTDRDFSEKASMIPRMRELHRRMDPTVPTGATIFLGDGITMAVATAAIAPHAVNYGIGSQRSDQLIESMELYDSINRAERVVITIGTNDVLQGREAGIESRYRAILGKVPPGVDVVLSSIPPIGITKFAGRIIEPSTVRAVADSAAAACRADRRCRFADTHNALSSGGRPLAGVLSEDGRHLTPMGSAMWIDQIRKAIASS
jgi:hypothetical protein